MQLLNWVRIRLNGHWLIFFLHNSFLVGTELCHYLFTTFNWYKKYYHFLLIDHTEVWLLQVAATNNFHDLLIFCSKWDWHQMPEHILIYAQDISMPAVSFAYTIWCGVDTVVQEGLTIPTHSASIDPILHSGTAWMKNVSCWLFNISVKYIPVISCFDFIIT